MNRATIDASARTWLRRAIACLCLGLFVAPAGSPAAADDEWGTVKLRIRCPDAAADNRPTDGSLVVDLKNGGVADVFVWVRGEIRRVHPSYATSDKDQITLQFEGKRIWPRTAIFRPSQTLVFEATDGETHLPNFHLAGICPALQPGAAMSLTVSSTRAIPQQVSCSVHPQEIAYIRVQDHPYAAVTEADGSAEIKNLPVGEYELQFWHERVGYPRGLQRAPEAAPAEKGRFRITVKPGMNDLGDVTVPRKNLDP